MTLPGSFDHLTHFLHWHCAIVIENFWPLLFVEAFIGTLRNASILHRGASLLKTWIETTALTHLVCAPKDSGVLQTLHWHTMQGIHPSQRCISRNQMTDNIFEIECTASDPRCVCSTRLRCPSDRLCCSTSQSQSLLDFLGPWMFWFAWFSFAISCEVLMQTPCGFFGSRMRTIPDDRNKTRLSFKLLLVYIGIFDPNFRWVQDSIVPRNADNLEFFQPAQCPFAAWSLRDLMLARAPVFRSVDCSVGLHTECPSMLLGSEKKRRPCFPGLGSRRIANNFEILRISFQFAHQKNWNNSLHCRPEKFVQRVMRTNAWTIILVERPCDFLICVHCCFFLHRLCSRQCLTQKSKTMPFSVPQLDRTTLTPLHCFWSVPSVDLVTRSVWPLAIELLHVHPLYAEVRGHNCTHLCAISCLGAWVLLSLPWAFTLVLQATLIVVWTTTTFLTKSLNQKSEGSSQCASPACFPALDHLLVSSASSLMGCALHRFHTAERSHVSCWMTGCTWPLSLQWMSHAVQPFCFLCGTPPWCHKGSSCFTMHLTARSVCPNPKPDVRFFPMIETFLKNLAKTCVCGLFSFWWWYPCCGQWNRCRMGCDFPNASWTNFHHVWSAHHQWGTPGLFLVPERTPTSLLRRPWLKLCPFFVLRALLVGTNSDVFFMIPCMHECVDHAAVLGIYGFVSGLYVMSRWIRRTFYTTCLYDLYLVSETLERFQYIRTNIASFHQDRV